MWIEYFGTLMSVIVAVSLMQKNIRWLRIINGIGAAGFSVYGAMIAAWPVLALNAFIVVIDFWYLLRMQNTDDHFDYLEVDGLKSAFVRKFIDFHRDDIKAFIPEFNPEDRDNVRGCLILRDTRPVSLVLYRAADEGDGEILLDYSVPSHRDFKNARFFFDYVLRHLDMENLNRLTARGSTKKHRAYLEKIGFRSLETSDGTPLFSRNISVSG
jgi:hypothetical protein